jgi:pilus assembly protein Flp/PilA
MRRFLARLRREDSGATAIEYGLIAGLIFLAILGALTAFADTSTGLFNGAMNAIRNAMGG